MLPGHSLKLRPHEQHDLEVPSESLTEEDNKDTKADLVGVLNRSLYEVANKMTK